MGMIARELRIRSLLVTVLALAVSGAPAPAMSQQEARPDTEQGKLFTTRYEREYLDTLRRNFLLERRARSFDIDSLPPPILENVEEEEQTEEPTPVTWHFGGVIERPNASAMVWINGELMDSSSLPAGTSLIRQAGSLMLRIRIEENEWLLRPGQTLDQNSGQIRDLIDIRSSPARPTGSRTLPWSMPLTAPQTC